MELLDIGELPLRCIAAFLAPYDARAFRATCAMVHAMIPATHKKRTPHAMWKWATRRGFDNLVLEAEDAGARDVMRLVPNVGYAEARKLWRDAFIHDGQYLHVSPKGYLRAPFESQYASIIRGDTTAIEKICSGVLTCEIARVIGKYASEAMVRLAVASSRDLPDANVMIDTIIGGVARSGRDALAIELIDARLAMSAHNVEYLCRVLLGAKRVDLFSRVSSHIPQEVREKLMFEEAIINDDARRYILRCDDSFIDVLLSLASETKGSEMCEFVRSTLGRRIDRITDSELSLMFSTALSSAAGVGNRDACEYLLDWACEYHIFSAMNVRSAIGNALHHDHYWIVDMLARRFPDAICREFGTSHREDYKLCRTIIRARLAQD